ncbi:spermidine synthase [Stenotrophomonas mori]|uniref:Spermine synthase n=1 Tax=Stenotrophomonas mori TaxID=2871096 RepID=A0ABT0SHQ7_9GAMM|nr:spermine synthase [Stenotrophomonas mori]MCL7714787.1 spermine synthase [Stenotrophomonas mori]
MPPLHGHRAGFHEAVSRPALPGEGVLVTDEHTGLQQARIVRHPVFGGQLFLDGDLQISESDAAYGIAMTNPLLGLERLERIAILGGGDGGVLWQLLRSLEPRTPRPRVTLVEIDARVIELCRAHLPAVCGDAFAHADADLRVGDAFAWIADARGLDAVIYDLTMDPVREGQSRDAFVRHIVALAARALRPGGVFSMQCCGHGHADPADRAERRRLLPVIRDAIDAHFQDRCEQEVLIPSYRDLWTFLCARTPA